MLQKILHLFQRLPGCVKAFPGNCREFGFKVASLQFWDVLIPRGKSKGYIEALSAYMIRELAPLTEKYRRGEFHNSQKPLDKTPLWVCWWQGEEKMPPIVKVCVDKMRRSLPDWARLHLITWDNLADYIDLPDHILEKHKKGLIGPAHLSDVLRFGLLSRYGGAWLDATVYVSGKFPEKLLTETFHTQRFAGWESCPREACRGKWCGFFLGGKADNTVFPFMYEALCFWWARHDRVPDYVFFDYVLWAGYEGVPAIRAAIDAVEPGNENMWLLAKKLNEPYDPAAYAALLESNDFFKLSYKGELNPQTPDGQETVYAHLLMG